MGRPRIGKTVMTPAERQQRRRAKLAEIVRAAAVLTALDRQYIRAGVNEQPDIRAGVKKLLARWEKQEAARKRWWRKSLKRAHR
jgi:hypothetical protein